MLENEGNLEQVNSDVDSEVSSEPQNTPAQQGDVGAQAQASEHKQPDTNQPFHEHPRFKELVEQKNQAIAAQKAYEQRIAQMESQLTKLHDGNLSKKQEDALIARLKGIDPEFGERFEKLDATQRELQELKAWKQESEQAQVRDKAVSTVNSLHEQHKVSAEMREIYNSQIELMASRNPNLQLSDLPQLYKQVHDSMSKIVEGIKRSERESYVSGKKQDSKIPTSQPKGKPATTQEKPQYSKDREEALSQITKSVLRQTRADKAL